MYHYGKEQRERAAMVDLGTQESVRQVDLTSLGEVRPLAEALEDWMRVLGFPRKDIFAVKLALGEAVINAFRHGNRGDPRKVVRVKYVVTFAEVLVEVADEGAGFDPDQVPDLLSVENIERIRGRGLFLMRVYMSGVSFHPPGNRVTLWRRRSAT
jgi:serine/threonine-protein kinase RsbW